ncbi:DUF4189 domain-containing protein [Dyella choica]|nr:DUF4189 domain-containing protein [Dyella choica]
MAMKFLSFILLLLASLVHRPAHAEGGCPPGMYPQSGQGWQTCVPIPGGNTSNQRANPYPETNYDGPAPGTYGALAYDRSTDMGYSVYAEFSRESAAAAALNQCQEKGSKSCEVVTTVHGSVTVVQDSAGKFFASEDPYSGDTIQPAFQKCNQQSLVGHCQLMSPPVIYGAVPSPNGLSFMDVMPILYGRDWAKKKRDPTEAMRLASDPVALSERLDTREYWGAIVASTEDIQSSYNQTDQKAAESLAISDCPNCKVVQVFKNTCAGFAWAKEKGHDLETALDPEPAAAKAAAQAKCTAKYGACRAMVRCSGRRYPRGNPEAAKQ